jgi:hypothetical protein
MEKMLMGLVEKNPKFKTIMATIQLFQKILPKFETRNIESEGIDYAAVLFDCTPENQRRVTAIEDLLTDILPPFIAYTDFELEGKFYAALLFAIPQKEGEK